MRVEIPRCEFWIHLLDPSTWSKAYATALSSFIAFFVGHHDSPLSLPDSYFPKLPTVPPPVPLQLPHQIHTSSLEKPSSATIAEISLFDPPHAPDPSPPPSPLPPGGRNAKKGFWREIRVPSPLLAGPSRPSHPPAIPIASHAPLSPPNPPTTKWYCHLVHAPKQLCAVCCNRVFATGGVWLRWLDALGGVEGGGVGTVEEDSAGNCEKLGLGVRPAEAAVIASWISNLYLQCYCT